MVLLVLNSYYVFNLYPARERDDERFNATVPFVKEEP